MGAAAGSLLSWAPKCPGGDNDGGTWRSRLPSRGRLAASAVRTLRGTRCSGASDLPFTCTDLPERTQLCPAIPRASWCLRRWLESCTVGPWTQMQRVQQVTLVLYR